MNTSGYSSYAQIADFGSLNPPSPGTDNDPLTYCLVETMDRNFQHGANSVTYGPRSQACQAFMAERCAKNWDGFCEYYYVNNNDNSQWPFDKQAWPNTFLPRNWANGLVPTLTNGEQLLQNAAELRYCSYRNCVPKKQPFNPLVAGSPMITTYYNPSSYSEECIPVCNVDPKTIDQDPLMDRCLENPKAAALTLINICNTAKRQGTDLSGTKIGAVCNRYFKNRHLLNA
jgi:hypothetical protein